MMYYRIVIEFKNGEVWYDYANSTQKANSEVGSYGRMKDVRKCYKETIGKEEYEKSVK